VSLALPRGRFLYLVQAVGAQWELVFGEGGSRFLYDSEAEALDAARTAARLHRLSQSQPSGVAIQAPAEQAPDAKRMIDYFGNWV
jgi:hypothetical protein